MILQVSGRTDICALYPKWFINRLKAGRVLVRNPYNEHLVSEIDITSDVVDCISFCTKDPQAIIPYLSQIDQMNYNYYFMITITPYDYDLEPGLRPKLEIIKTFIELSKLIGKERVIWRYDPILLNERYTIEFHIQMFLKMTQLLYRYTNTVIISFLDIYKNIEGKFNELNDQDVFMLAKELGKIANEYDLHIQTCSEKYYLQEYGIAKGSCNDKEYIERIIGYPLDIKPNKNRANCFCVASIDIGAYSCCAHGCLYCYACNHQLVADNMAKHDENGLLLLGDLTADDKIVKRAVSSNKARQIKLDI